MTRWDQFWQRVFTIHTRRGEIMLWPIPPAITDELLDEWPVEWEMWRRVLVGLSRSDVERSERAFVWSRRFWYLTYWSIVGRGYRALKRLHLYYADEGGLWREGRWTIPTTWRRLMAGRVR